MNELINESLDFKKRSLINSMKPEFLEHYKDNFASKEFNFFPFAAYCHAYAEYLLNTSEYNEYGNFIDEYNAIIEEDKTYKWMKETQQRTTDPLSIFTQNFRKAYISDSRHKIKEEEFVSELDFEKVICDNFDDYFGGELEIERQKTIGYGKSDILINKNIVIELKKSVAKRKDVYQAFEYSFGGGIEVVCLITQGFNDEVLDIAQKLNVECYRYAFGRDPDASGDYPVGVFFEKVSKTPRNQFDKILEEADHSILFSNYDTRFDFNESLKKQIHNMNAILERTDAAHEAEKELIIEKLDALGYDTSKGLEALLKEVEAEKRA